ncbi:hypothetical protein BJV82DRAFT_655685 [Fennellomyces sp. T-0311]|nr:hypothetical protein BJV82DRAFT_655685 [Fennellomyces sp. T-0311]
MANNASSSLIDKQQRDNDVEQTSSVQAWLHSHLDNYVELSLLENVPDLGDSRLGDGTALLCLAHRFCPTSVPDLLNTLRDEATDRFSLATQIFHDNLNIAVPNQLNGNDALASYVANIKQVCDAMEPTMQSLRMTQLNMVSERQWIQVTRRTRENTVEDDEFERRAIHVLNKISQLRNQLNDMTLLTTSSTPARQITNEEEAVNGDSDDRSSDDLAANVQQFESSLDAFEKGDLAEIHAYIRDMPDDARTSVCARIQAIDAAHAALEAQLQEDFRAIRMGVQFAQLTTPIRNELEFIQAKMLKTTTTEEGIRELEDRSRHAGTMIRDMEASHSAMVGATQDDGDAGQQRSFRVHFDALKQKHRLISSWVEEVRVWFIEAERIRRWIEERIQAIEAAPFKDALQTVDLSEYSLTMVDKLNTKHETMEKEVEKFNKEDITRLRGHVKALTGPEKQDDKDLSPADTTTIEITFTTLMTLDKLMHLMRRRSYGLQMLTLRLFWEREHFRSRAWVSETDGEVDLLLQRARWQQDEEKETDRAEAETTKNMTVHMLLDIERRASEFDQGQFTTTVNMYQEMDDSSKVELPPHLESRQVELEEAFEALTKRLSYVRQVVEQRLTVVDFIYRADELTVSGEQLHEEITVAEQQVTDADSDRDFTEQIRYFQEQAVQLVTAVAARIRYPEDAYPPSDIDENDKVNETVRGAISARRSSLILLGEALDHKLQSYRRALELQKSASQLSDDMRQLEDTVERQIRSVLDAKLDVMAVKPMFGQEDIEELQSERDEWISKAGSLKNADWRILKDYLDTLKDDVEAAGATAVSLDVLYETMERIYKRLGALEAVLTAHTADLEAFKKRVDWDINYDKAMYSISMTLHAVWEILQQMQWRPDIDELLKPTDLSQKIDMLQTKIDDFNNLQDVELARKSFQAMANDLTKLPEAKDGIPSHLCQRQDALEQNMNGLDESVKYAHGVHGQHAALLRYMDHAKTIYNTGMEATEKLEGAVKNVMTNEPYSFKNELQRFNQSVDELWTGYGNTVPYPVCSANACASHPSSSGDESINNDIRAAVKVQQEQLEEINQNLSQLAAKYDTASKLKQEVVDFTAEAKNLHSCVNDVLTAIAASRQDLAVDAMDINALPDMDGLQKENKGFVQQVEEAVSGLDALQKRCAQIDQSVHKSECHPEVSTVMATEMLGALSARVNELKKVSALHSQELNVSAVRIDWERKSQKATQMAESVHGQLRQFVDRKNMLTPANAEPDQLAQLDAQAQSIQKDVSSLSHNTMDAVLEAYDKMTVAYADASTSLPRAVVDRQYDLKSLVSRLSDMSDQSKRELEFLTERAKWERAATETTDSCAHQEQKIEDFIQDSARWSAGSSLADVSAKLGELEQHVDVVTQQCTELVKQCQCLMDQQMEAPDTLVRRKNIVESSIQRLQDHLAFAKEVVDQRDMFGAYTEEAQKLESLCETIKNDIETDAAGQDTVQTYTDRINTFCRDDSSSLPYPVRSFKGHDPRSRALDESANIVVAEAFLGHHSRLKELPGVLTAALKSKQLRSERKAAGDAYMTEAESVEAWINGKLETLEKALDLGDSDAQKIESLQSAIATVDATFAAMQSYNSAYNSLKLDASKLDDNDQVRHRQEQLDTLWAKLSSDAGAEAKDKLKEQLRQAEFNGALREATDQSTKLQEQLSVADLGSLSDDQMAEWRDQTQLLKAQYLEKLGSTHRGSGEKDQYDQVVADHEKLEQSLHDLDNRLHKRRLAVDYDKRTDGLTDHMHEITKDLDDMRDKYGSIRGSDATEDEATCQGFLEAYQHVHLRIQEHMEQAELQRSFFRLLQAQDAVTNDINSKQQKFEEDYSKLEVALENAKVAKEHVFQWNDLHTKLKAIQDKADSDEDEIAVLESKLALAQTMADKLGANNGQSANKEKFMQHYSAVATMVTNTKQALEIKAQEARELASLEACREATDAIKRRCTRELSAIKARIRTAGEQSAERFQDIKSIERQYRRSTIGSATTQIGVYDELTEELSSLQAKAINDSERQLIAEARDAVRDLNDGITAEQRWNETVRRALGHAKTGENITSWIDNCRNAIASVSANIDVSSDKDMEAELRSIQHKIADFSSIIESFNTMSQGLLETDGGSNEEELSIAIQSLKKDVVQPRADRIDSEWQALHDQLSELEASMMRASKGVAVVRQMKKVLKVCVDAHARLDLLEKDPSRVTLSSAHKQHERPLSGVLREQDVLAIEQALNTIESEAQDHAKRELQTLDSLITDFGDADGAFMQQRGDMEAALQNMTDAIGNKRQNLAKALEVGKCLMITDDIDVLVDALEDAVGKATTATSKPNPSKADMQGKFIELDARYKYYERKITQSLDAAQLATDDITDEKDRQMIVDHISQLRKRWEGVDQQARSQRAELSKAMAAGQVNRARKSSLPTRKASNFLRDRDRSPSRLPAPPTGAHGNTSSPLLTSNRLLPSTSLPRPTARPTTNTSSSRLTPPSVRRPFPSKSTNNPKKPPAPPPPPANQYVADPKNDLDMEIGRIVNETPYRVKVKMVPGEVGRYWFGDANPKLAYCRVLKSKMVMVRVGGGWMELSQFLRGHALLDNSEFIPKTVEPDNSSVLPFQENFIETRRRRNRSPSSSTSNTNNNNLLPLPPSTSISSSRSTPQNTPTGYIDGDRYIAVDRYGNQLEVKMTKAPDKISESNSGSTRLRMKSNQ